MSLRPIKRLVKSKPTMEGAGVKLRRARKERERGSLHVRRWWERGMNKAAAPRCGEAALLRSTRV